VLDPPGHRKQLDRHVVTNPRNRYHAAEQITAKKPREAEHLLAKSGLHKSAKHNEDGL